MLQVYLKGSKTDQMLQADMHLYVGAARPLDPLDSRVSIRLAVVGHLSTIAECCSMLKVHNPRGQPEIMFSSDASGSWGCGAAWNERWIQMEWNGSWDQQCIAAKELLTIALACAIWGAQWQHRQVLVWCDNMAVVSIVASQTSKDSHHAFTEVHAFFSGHYTTSWCGPSTYQGPAIPLLMQFLAIICR